MDQETNLLIKELRTLDVLKIIQDENFNRSPKSIEESKKSRKKGNELYVKRKHTPQMHYEILKYYSKSVAFAPNQSEDLAQAYGNRSALLFHLKKYEKCIQDINRALKITKIADLRERLLERKKQCLKLLLNLPETKEAKMNEVCKSTCELNEHSTTALNDKIAKMPNKSSNISKNREEIDNALEDLSKKCPLNSVAIKHTEKYGRHLIATRDIKPGEIIFVEKSYVNSFNTKMLYTHCGHCLTMVWDGIPCDHCAWFVYCSEKCKIEAWNEYHDIECFCIFYILVFTQHVKDNKKQNVYFDGISIRALIKGLREVGDLKQLKAEVQAIDRCKDKCTKGFSYNGKFESNKFRSLYSLSRNISDSELKGHAVFASISLVCLAKFTSFFGKNFKFTIKNLIENPDAIFVGALLMKLSKISSVNGHNIINVTESCKYLNDPITCRTNWCCVKGSCIVPIASLINNSCNPNARRCFSDKQKFVLYAVQSIKKNSQIFDSYFCSFYESENPLRRSTLKKSFNFKCDCAACKKNWPSYPILKMSSKEISQSIKLSPKELELWQNYSSFIQEIEERSIELNEELLCKLSEAIVNSLQLLQPSIITYKIIYTLIQVFEILFGYATQVFEGC